MEKSELEKLKSAELRKLRGVFKDIEENQKKVIEKLIDNAAFMAANMQILQKHISKNGSVETYKNGANQEGRKKSAEVEVYNAMIKNYTAAVKQLVDMLPCEERKSDELLEFLGVKPK